MASVAYMDPGNFATNIQAGSDFNYRLLWVLLWANLMAIVIQLLSAKLGIATGKTLPQNCRAHFSRTANFLLWIAAEVGALATDLAEFLGAALGFYLLFRIPIFPSALITGVIVFLILAVEQKGYRTLEYVIMAFVAGIGVSYAFEVFLARPEWNLIAMHTLVPRLSSQSIYIAVGMLGATVMPHVVYLHSALVQPRNIGNNLKQKYRHFLFERADVFLAMNGAWLINSAMVIMAAAVFFRNGVGVISIEQAHETLTPLLGPLSSFVFALALLFSGLSSSTVATMAGQMILEGFLNVRFSIFLRRFLTMLPSFVVIAIGLNPLKILVLSQVALSFTLPFALIPLLMLTRRKNIMGELVNRPATNSFAGIIIAIVIFLNCLLLYQTFGGSF